MEPVGGLLRAAFSTGYKIYQSWLWCEMLLDGLNLMRLWLDVAVFSTANLISQTMSLHVRVCGPRPVTVL